VARAKITLNGKDVEVPAGITILEAARRHGVEIPTLCHDEQLEPFASCWLCVVKLEGVARYVPACGTKVAPGMKIWTDTEDVRAVRRMALELLLSNHRGDCEAPCKTTCPASVDVQGYIALIAQGRYREATRLVKEVNPFPLAIGRVCPRPCEGECRRNALDGPVGIDYLKRFAADWDATHGEPWSPEVARPTGKRVAMVGAGPSSLTAAYYLTQAGHAVTIHEALPAPGGMLRYGIPEYRLPKAILDTEIGLITGLGTEVEYGRTLGRDFTIADLFDRGFDAVFLGLGAMASRRMGVPGEDLDGVWAGTEFLKKVALGEPVEIGRRVAIIGGGNTAIDASRTALRLGAERVTIVYRRSRQEMPAWGVEVEAARHEGVEMHFLAAPTGIEGDGRCERMEYIRMELGEPDSSGRRRPVPIEGSEEVLEIDNVIAAIGQTPELSCIHETAERDPGSIEARIELTRWGTIVADEHTLLTSVDGVFAGGDVVNGAATAIEAIAHGGRAARAIDRFLRGERPSDPAPFFNIRKERWDEYPRADLERVEPRPRQEMPELPVAERILTFDETELGLTEEQAREEAKRCLECGCVAAFSCKLREYAAEYGATYDRFGGEVVRDEADGRHPFIRIEPEKCILCARCIRICEDVEGASALGFFRRGFAAQMKPALDRALADTTCESCGQCVTACPTAALSAVADLPKPGPWALEGTRSTCTFCGTGCAISLNTAGGVVVTVTPAADPGPTGPNLCVRGRFGLPAVLNDGRLDDALVRWNGKQAELPLGQAVDLAAERLRGVARERGPGAVAVFGSPRLTNEEAYLLQKLARRGLGTPNVGSFGLAAERPVFEALRRAVGEGRSTADYDDVLAADTIVLLDSDIAEEQTVAGIAVRKAVTRGARLFVVAGEETRMARLADTWIQADRRELSLVLAAMIAHAIEDGPAGRATAPYAIDGLDELAALLASRRGERERSRAASSPDVAAAARALAEAPRSVLIANAMSFDPATAARDASLAVAFAAVAGKVDGDGSGVLFLRMRANGQGVTDAGLDPGLLPGGAGCDDREALARISRLHGADPPLGEGLPADRIIAAIEAGEVAALVIAGEDPIAGADDPERMAGALEALDTLVVLDSFSTETVRRAHVALPLATAAESSGSFTGSDGRVRPVSGAVPPACGLSSLAILSRLASRLGVGQASPSLREVRSELAEAAPGLALDARTAGGAPARAARLAVRRASVLPAVPTPPIMVFDPRWTDALESRFSARVEDLGLSPRVVRRLAARS
jgi:formate dehydrogenase major subunit